MYSIYILLEVIYRYIRGLRYSYLPNDRHKKAQRISLGKHQHNTEVTWDEHVGRIMVGLFLGVNAHINQSPAEVRQNESLKHSFCLADNTSSLIATSLALS